MCNVWENASKSEELSFEEIKSAIAQCREWGVKEVNLCGGEPLLNDDCFDIINYAKQLQMKVVLTTNGTLINESVARKLIDSGLDIITISLDGARPETHDKIRGQSGAFEKIMFGIKYLNDFKKGPQPVKVLILTISDYNLDELEDYFSLARSLSVDALYLTSLVLDNVKLYARDQTPQENDLWIKGERLEKLDQVIDRVFLLQKEQYGLNYPSFPLIKKYFRGEVKAKDWVCFAGYRRLVLVPGGSIQMCGESIGNFRKITSVRKLWNSRPARERRAGIKKCRNFCLQDCHAREESASCKKILQAFFKN